MGQALVQQSSVPYMGMQAIATFCKLLVRVMLNGAPRFSLSMLL